MESRVNKAYLNIVCKNIVCELGLRKVKEKTSTLACETKSITSFYL